ncbi:MAG TPA: DUF3040 domain-containing protein [Pseudonocardia sp.]
MLSDDERRALRDIELTVSAEDPGFAALLSPRTSRVIRRVRFAYDAVAGFSILLALVCLPLGQLSGGFEALLFAALVIALRRRRFPTVPAPSGIARPGSPTNRL